MRRAERDHRARDLGVNAPESARTQGGRIRAPLTMIPRSVSPTSGSRPRVSRRWLRSRREDDADGFRWDPEDDQRYALRYDDPSLVGAALTVVGANRLAAVGFLSFPTASSERGIQSAGAVREKNEWFFVWPIWLSRLSRVGIESLLAHPDLLNGERARLRSLGIAEIFRARRVANGKFMNVARAQPIEDSYGARTPTR